MFHIVIDSAIDHLQDYPSFTVIPLYLRVGEKFLKDRVEITRDKFYSIMSSVIDTFTTSQPSPEDFKKVFQSIPEQTYCAYSCIQSERNYAVSSGRSKRNH